MSSLARYRRLAAEVQLFHNLRPEDVAKIFSRGITEHVPKGTVLFYQNTSGNTMYVVLEGKIALFDGKKPIASLHAGDMLGEMALLKGDPRSATAVAAEDSHLFVLSETVFHKLLTKRVAIQILLNIAGTLSERLREANKRIGTPQMG